MSLFSCTKIDRNEMKRHVNYYSWNTTHRAAAHFLIFREIGDRLRLDSYFARVKIILEREYFRELLKIKFEPLVFLCSRDRVVDVVAAIHRRSHPWPTLGPWCCEPVTFFSFPTLRPSFFSMGNRARFHHVRRECSIVWNYDSLEARWRITRGGRGGCREAELCWETQQFRDFLQRWTWNVRGTRYRSDHGIGNSIDFLRLQRWDPSAIRYRRYWKIPRSSLPLLDPPPISQLWNYQGCACCSATSRSSWSY